jgi:hypothetical protein
LLRLFSRQHDDGQRPLAVALHGHRAPAPGCTPVTSVLPAAVATRPER